MTNELIKKLYWADVIVKGSFNPIPARAALLSAESMIVIAPVDASKLSSNENGANFPCFILYSSEFSLYSC